MLVWNGVKALYKRNIIIMYKHTFFEFLQVNHRLTIVDRNQSSNKTWKTIICTIKFGLLGKFCYRDTYAPSP
jgi:hypothetical protein